MPLCCRFALTLGVSCEPSLRVYGVLGWPFCKFMYMYPSSYSSAEDTALRYSENGSVICKIRGVAGQKQLNPALILVFVSDRREASLCTGSIMSLAR